MASPVGRRTAPLSETPRPEIVRLIKLNHPGLREPHAFSIHSEIPDPDRRFFTTIGTLLGGRIGVGAAAAMLARGGPVEHVTVEIESLPVVIRRALRHRTIHG